jgi:DNA modification methylase
LSFNGHLKKATGTVTFIHSPVYPDEKDARSRCREDNYKSGIYEIYNSYLEFPPESVKRVGHPAPFPEDLPIRFIQLYAFEDNVVLDLSYGSGTTCIDAVKTKKHYICFDNNGEHVNLMRKRISNAIKALEENGERT